MSWWASFKNIYGLIMGTSTDWMKPTKRPHWPTNLHQVDEQLQVFLGGTGNCGVLYDGDKALVINCNSGRSARKFKESISDKKVDTLVGTSPFPDYVGGLTEFEFRHVFLPSSFSGSNSEIPIEVVKESFSFPWGDEEVVVEQIENTFSTNDLVVYLKNRKTLFLGGLFFNKIHPILDQQKGIDPTHWREELLHILEKYPADTIVPHEGDLCSPLEVQLFVSYLDCLSDPKVEFSYCREHFDWVEIPGITSLEENFDHFRSL